MRRLLASTLMCLTLCNWAQADIAIVANPSFGVDALSTDEVQRYYLKRKLITADGALVHTAALPPESPATLAFNQQVLLMTEHRLLAYWAQKVFSGNAKPPQVFLDAADVKHWVSTTPNALGYIDIMDVDDSVKVLLTVATDP